VIRRTSRTTVEAGERQRDVYAGHPGLPAQAGGLSVHGRFGGFSTNAQRALRPLRVCAFSGWAGCGLLQRSKLLVLRFNDLNSGSDHVEAAHPENRCHRDRCWSA
jgi:hypothetical protein